MKLKDTKFSVLLPVLDREDIYIGFPIAIKSIFDNNLKPSQVVVTVDGLASNKFRQLLYLYEKQYSLDLIWINKKVGLDKALNIGIKKCENEIIFRADGDDFNEKNRFETQLPFLINDYDLVGSNIDEYDELNNFITSKKVPCSNQKIAKMIAFRNPINHMTVGFKKSIILSVGGYPELFLKGDYGLWIKLKAKGFKFKNINKSLVRASTGRRMIRDRGGIRYVYSEFLLQKFLYSYGLTNIFLAVIVFFIRSFVFLLPVAIRKIIYLNYLRS
tara:strand:+ start:1634 stop:2452 length:819 start_codon:yes stop_codon:yes gene_type:complete